MPIYAVLYIQGIEVYIRFVLHVTFEFPDFFIHLKLFFLWNKVCGLSRTQIFIYFQTSFNTLNIRLSYNDMRLFKGILNSLPQQAVQAKNQAQPKNAPKTTYPGLLHLHCHRRISWKILKSLGTGCKRFASAVYHVEKGNTYRISQLWICYCYFLGYAVSLKWTQSWPVCSRCGFSVFKTSWSPSIVSVSVSSAWLHFIPVRV